MEGYDFRFPLSTTPNLQAHGLKDLFDTNLRELFRLLVPTKGEQELMADGYKLLNDRHTIHPLYPPEGEKSLQQSGPQDLYEPRISFIQHILESLLSIIDLEAKGETVHIDGFRLKNLKQWLGSGGGASDILAHAASRCNLRCGFCYNQGTPSILKPRPRKPEDEFKEIKTRIDHYVPKGRLNLFPNMGSPAEALAHPYILEILQELRQTTEEPLRIPTNGSMLTPQTVQKLAKFKPIYLDISLNSASPKRRHWLMQDPEPHTALDSLNLLKDVRIPYSVVIVPWPFPSRQVMVDDLKNTVAFAAAHDPTLIQISLPGYSGALSEKWSFPHQEVWEEIKKTVQELRIRTDCPLVVRPGLFEEYADPERLNTPLLIGVIKNSPAANAGLCMGDRLIKINGLSVKNRPQARSLLTILHQSDLGKASLSIQRDGTRLDLDLNLSDFDYPFTPETATHLGMIFSSLGIPQEWLERLKEAISARGAKEVLVLTSSLVRPFMEKSISQNGFLSGVRTRIRVPGNHYFGGNIYMGDLMVVQDFIDAIEEFMDSGEVEPDLVVIPSSPFHLSGWGRDLIGRVYLDIERSTGIPVALVECEPIFD